MRSYGHVVHGSFLNLDNANKFAAEQKQEFFDRAQDESPNYYYSGVVLDEDYTIHEENERLFHFYGVTDDEENAVTVRVTESVFLDEPQAIITVPEPIS